MKRTMRIPVLLAMLAVLAGCSAERPQNDGRVAAEDLVKWEGLVGDDSIGLLPVSLHRSLDQPHRRVSVLDLRQHRVFR